jgi:predicted nucleic acid-binding protein
MIATGRLEILALSVQHMNLVAQVSKRFGLDFDDAYQYVTAEKHRLIIVSFHGDFDRTDKGRKTPQAALQG